jgi:hypothetical protein
VRRILRNRTTGRFYLNGEWTEDPELAENFSSTQEAIGIVVEKQLQDVELILAFGWEPSRIYDVCLPLFPTAEEALHANS